MAHPELPLEGVRVVDFSTLAPGPLATLILAAAGAEVTRVVRPGGDEMRAIGPQLGGEGVMFAYLDRFKRSLTLDLKRPADRRRAQRLIADSEVLVEQFRPGVMARLGLGYEQARALNPALVYCSITGFGQSGERAGQAGHDLNYLAETGLLALGGPPRAAGGAGPALPGTLIADLAGGSYPAVMSILLALRRSERRGEGAHLDVSMAGNLFTLMFWAQAELAAGNPLPAPGGAWPTGGSPRYQVYATADGGLIAAAPLEERFWQRFCAAIELPVALRDDRRDAPATLEAVAGLIGARPTAHWQAVLARADCCCCRVRGLDEALADEGLRSRRAGTGRLEMGGRSLDGLALPLDAALCRATPDGDRD